MCVPGPELTDSGRLSQIDSGCMQARMVWTVPFVTVRLPARRIVWTVPYGLEVMGRSGRHHGEGRAVMMIPTSLP